MPLPPVVALEIGTTKIVALVGEMRDDGRVIITGMGEHESKGIRKGEVVDLETAGVCVRTALHAAEESGQVTVRQVHVALSGGHIQSVTNRGTIRVHSPQDGVSDADIEQVTNLGRAINLPPDRDVIHTICQHFCIDDQKYIVSPEGMGGAKLSVDMLALHGSRNRLRNTIKVVQNVPMNVEDVVFSGLCSSLAVLTPEQKEVGALVIDLGGGTTDYVAYCGKILSAAGALGVGGDHVTNDIALAFNISIKQAERLKRQFGTATLESSVRSRRVELEPEIGFPDRSVSLPALQTVINARMDEILTMIRRRLEDYDITHQIGAGVILTGGGARLANADKLAQKVFGLPCTIGHPSEVDGLASATGSPEYATPVGMVRYGFMMGERDAGFSITDWLKSLISRGK